MNKEQTLPEQRTNDNRSQNKADPYLNKSDPYLNNKDQFWNNKDQLTEQTRIPHRTNSFLLCGPFSFVLGPLSVCSASVPCLFCQPFSFVLGRVSACCAHRPQETFDLCELGTSKVEPIGDQNHTHGEASPGYWSGFQRFF